MYELDEFDRKLLNIIQNDASLTAEQMAEQVSLSASAIQRRLKRLRKDGVIERQIAVIDPRHAGRPNTFIVSVLVERETPERLSRFRSWLIAQPNIQQIFYVTGDADYILVVTAPDTDTYDRLMSELVGDNPNVKRFTTHVALTVIKRGLSIPLPIAHDAE